MFLCMEPDCIKQLWHSFLIYTSQNQSKVVPDSSSSFIQSIMNCERGFFPSSLDSGSVNTKNVKSEYVTI